jgi:hypothetical protein
MKLKKASVLDILKTFLTILKDLRVLKDFLATHSFYALVEYYTR